MVEVNIRMQRAVAGKKKGGKKKVWRGNPIWGLCSLENEGTKLQTTGIFFLLLLVKSLYGSNKTNIYYLYRLEKGEKPRLRSLMTRTKLVCK